MPTVTAGWFSAPSTSTTSSTAPPLGAASDTRALTWQTPARPGARPEKKPPPRRRPCERRAATVRARWQAELAAPGRCGLHRTSGGGFLGYAIFQPHDLFREPEQAIRLLPLVRSRTRRTGAEERTDATGSPPVHARSEGALRSPPRRRLGGKRRRDRGKCGSANPHLRDNLGLGSCPSRG